MDWNVRTIKQDIRESQVSQTFIKLRPRADVKMLILGKLFKNKRSQMTKMCLSLLIYRGREQD